MNKRFTNALWMPITDYLQILNAYSQGFKISDLIGIFSFLMIAWFIYVPIHELLHAAGCWLSGGTVSQLEIAPEYGAAFLQQFFPLVSVGSEYAGRLSGFDTHGSDIVYLVTVFFPYLLTIFIGVPLLKSCQHLGTHRVWQSVKIGVALPMAYAPFISLTGDYYEMGSILVSRGVPTNNSDALERWRSDDLFLLINELFFQNGSGDMSDAVIIVLSLLTGILLAFMTYWAGALLVKCAPKQCLGARRG